jgi:hypothetical protein
MGIPIIALVCGVFVMIVLAVISFTYRKATIFVFGKQRRGLQIFGIYMLLLNLLIIGILQGPNVTFSQIVDLWTFSSANFLDRFWVAAMWILAMLFFLPERWLVGLARLLNRSRFGD